MTIERIYINKEEMVKIESQIRFQAHIMRYAAVRRFVYGVVIDFACGCGYGTNLLSMNPEVKSIVGIDRDTESIEWARREFRTKNCSFLCEDIESLRIKCDTLVSLETIEHFTNDDLYHKIIENCDVDQLIISYPNKKSTNFNKFHHRDLNLQMVCDSFSEKFILVHCFAIGDVDILVFTKKPDRMPSHIFKNIIDLR